MESPPAKQTRLEEELAEFWQSIPNELKIKILSFLPSPDKFIYRRVCKGWKNVLWRQDIWIHTTRLTLGGTYWSTNEGIKLRLRPVDRAFDSDDDEDLGDVEDSDDDEDSEEDAVEEEDVQVAVQDEPGAPQAEVSVQVEDVVQDEDVQAVQVADQDESDEQEEKDGKDKVDGNYSNQTSDFQDSGRSNGAFFHKCKLIEWGLEKVLEEIRWVAPIQSLEIMDQEYPDGIDARDLMGLYFLTKRVKETEVLCLDVNLVSLVISNVHYCHLYDDLFGVTLAVNSLVEKQSQLERLIIGPYVQWSEFPDGPDVDSLGFFNYESYVQSGFVEKALPELGALKELEKLRVLVLYTCAIRDLRELSPSALNRLRVLIVVQFESDDLEEAEIYVQEHAPRLHRRTDADFSLVWTADETADVNTLVKRKTDSVDFLARFAEFKKTEEIREARVKVELEREEEEWRNRKW